MFQIFGLDPYDALLVFMDSYLFVTFTFICVFSIMRIINNYFAHKLFQSATTNDKERMANYNKIMFWTENKCRLNQNAINIRGSWAKRVSKIPPKINPMARLGTNMIESFIHALAGGPVNMIFFFICPKVVALHLPFNIPSILLPLFQLNIGPGASTQADISLYSLYLFSSFFLDVFVEWVPFIRPRTKTPETLGPLEIFADDFLMKDSKWELDTAEDELSKFLDGAIKKNQ